MENENRIPVNYVLPPGVQREEINANSSIIRQNEQSLSLKVKDLNPGDSRAVYKNLDFDMRQYKKLKMYKKEKEFLFLLEAQVYILRH